LTKVATVQFQLLNAAMSSPCVTVVCSMRCKSFSTEATLKKQHSSHLSDWENFLPQTLQTCGRYFS
ncbi:hypothetical protein T4C_11047, partial [Trichinella pseudospiralis]